MGNKIRVGITHGDINGIGPEVALKALADERILDLMTPVLYSSSRVVQHYRKACELPHIKFNISDTADDIVADAVNLVNVVDESVKIETGIPTKEGGSCFRLARVRCDRLAGRSDRRACHSSYRQEDYPESDFYLSGTYGISRIVAFRAGARQGADDDGRRQPARCAPDSPYAY